MDLFQVSLCIILIWVLKKGDWLVLVNYLEYYKRIVTLIKKGGVIVLDNMLWSGEVISPQDDESISGDTGSFSLIEATFKVGNTGSPG